MTVDSLTFSGAQTALFYGNNASAEKLTSSDLRGVEKQESSDTAKMRDACREFESYFLSYMFKAMRRTVPESGFISGGDAEEMFQDMYADAISQEAAKGPGIGIGDMLYRDLSRQAQKSESPEVKEGKYDPGSVLRHAPLSRAEGQGVTG